MNSSQEIILKEKKNERINDCYQAREGFPDSSVGKESTFNAGYLVQFLGQEDPLEKGQAGYPLQYSWASLVAQPVKNLPVMWKTWV